jgi:hypothetical protein
MTDTFIINDSFMVDRRRRRKGEFTKINRKTLLVSFCILCADWEADSFDWFIYLYRDAHTNFLWTAWSVCAPLIFLFWLQQQSSCRYVNTCKWMAVSSFLIQVEVDFNVSTLSSRYIDIDIESMLYSYTKLSIFKRQNIVLKYIDR